MVGVAVFGWWKYLQLHVTPGHLVPGTSRDSRVLSSRLFGSRYVPAGCFIYTSVFRCVCLDARIGVDIHREPPNVDLPTNPFPLGYLLFQLGRASMRYTER